MACFEMKHKTVSPLNIKYKKKRTVMLILFLLLLHEAFGIMRYLNAGVGSPGRGAPLYGEPEPPRRRRVHESPIGCISTDKMYVLNLHAHVQGEIARTIEHLAYNGDSIDPNDTVREKNGKNPDLEAVKSYLGTIMDKINIDLYKYGVRINLILPEQAILEYNLETLSDPSCEISGSVKTFTNEQLSKLSAQDEDSVGVHVFLFSCMNHSPEQDMTYVTTHKACGRVMGVMWNGSRMTEASLKSIILEAITGIPNAYETGTLELGSNKPICDYFSSCIGLTDSKLGAIINHREMVFYTDQEDDHHSDRIDER
ncbi:hypothetical protein PAEPH01_2591 [Pancytospora epiphaga]|nr:hypothetical protein PAEPH01_2591 [Pancytospora epiphaga]